MSTEPYIDPLYPCRAVEALRVSAAAALTPVEAARWSSQAERLAKRRAGLLQRWDAAFATLHAELQSLRARLAVWARARRANPDRDPDMSPGTFAAPPVVGGVPLSCA